jgi:hypothetical protein
MLPHRGRSRYYAWCQVATHLWIDRVRHGAGEEPARTLGRPAYCIEAECATLEPGKMYSMTGGNGALTLASRTKKVDRPIYVHRQTGVDRNNTIAARIPTFQIFRPEISRSYFLISQSHKSLCFTF